MASHTESPVELVAALKSVADGVQRTNELLRNNLQALQPKALEGAEGAPTATLPAKQSVGDLRETILSHRKGQTTVEINVKFIKIGEVSTKNQQFTAEIRLDARWREPGLAGKTGEELEELNESALWDPKLLIMNMDTKPSIDKRWYDFECVGEGAPVVVCKRKIRGQFYEDLELRNFPCDTQKLSLGIVTEHPARQVDIRVSQSHPSCVYTSQFRDQDEWTLYKVVDHEDTLLQRNPFISQDNLNRPVTDSGSVSMVDISPVVGVKHRKRKIFVCCYVSRNVGFWFWNVITVLLLITCLTFTPYAFKPEQTTSRLGVMMSLLLTTIAKKLALGHMLPSISYLTFLDMYILGVLGFLGIQSAQFAIASIWVKEGNLELIKKIDLGTLCFMASVLLVFNLVAVLMVRFTAFAHRARLREREKHLDKGILTSARYAKTGSKGEREKLNPATTAL